MTWNDLVRKHIPSATDEDCEYILLNETEFPCVLDRYYIEKQIVKYVNKKVITWY